MSDNMPYWVPIVFLVLACLFTASVSFRAIPAEECFEMITRYQHVLNECMDALQYCTDKICNLECAE